MQVLSVTNQQDWDGALLALPHPHILQSWAWGDFKSRHGWRPQRLLFQEEGRTVAAASLLRRTIPVLPTAICYAPKGPILDWTDEDRAERVLAVLEREARRWDTLFVKIDPDLYYPDHAPAFSPCPPHAPQMAALLQRRGWRFSNDQIQFRNTVLLDLEPEEDDLLAAMKQKSRYNIRLAARRGVTIRQGEGADLPLFYQLYAETAQRDRFLIRAPHYYEDAWGSFLQAGLATLLLAEVEGQAVAGLILFIFGNRAWYMYGASSNQHRDKMPNYLLQWEAIRHARARGCTVYDLWGAPEELEESDPMWGVVRFKLGLGGQIAQGLGAWDYAARGVPYRFYTQAMPRLLDLLRGRRRYPPSQ